MTEAANRPLYANLYYLNGFLALECLYDPDTVNQDDVDTYGIGTVIMSTEYVAISQEAYDALKGVRVESDDTFGVFDIFPIEGGKSGKSGLSCLSHIGHGHQLFEVSELGPLVSREFEVPDISAFHSIIPNDNIPEEARQAILAEEE